MLAAPVLAALGGGVGDCAVRSFGGLLAEEVDDRRLVRGVGGRVRLQAPLPPRVRALGNLVEVLVVLEEDVAGLHKVVREGTVAIELGEGLLGVRDGGFEVEHPLHLGVVEVAQGPRLQGFERGPVAHEGLAQLLEAFFLVDHRVHVRVVELVERRRLLLVPTGVRLREHRRRRPQCRTGLLGRVAAQGGRVGRTRQAPVAVVRVRRRQRIRHGGHKGVSRGR